MTWLLTVLGAALVLVALRDIFHTLWHPRGFGSLARLVFALLWRATRGMSTELSGPLGLLAVVGTWTVLVIVGWTLVYLPHMPEQFYFSSSLQPGRSSDLVASLYLSLVAVATLGLGDIMPAHPALRVVVPLQALLGFVLLTAAISWVLQVYPALTRRRSLAKQLSMLAGTGGSELVSRGKASVVAGLLRSLASDLTTVRVDLTQYGESYYFREEDPALSLAANLPYALDLAAAARQSESPEVRHFGALLDEAVASTATALAPYVGAPDSVASVLLAVAEDHGQRPLREAS